MVKKNKFERYGDENYYNIEKAKKTNLERYGVEWTGMVKEFRDKQKKTLYQNIKDKYSLLDIQNIDGVMTWTVSCTDCDCNLCKEKCFDINSRLYFSRLSNNSELCTIKNPINYDHIISCGENDFFTNGSNIFIKSSINCRQYKINLW